MTCRAVAGKVAVEVRWGAATSLTLDSGKVAASTGPGASRWVTASDLNQGRTRREASSVAAERCKKLKVVLIDESISTKLPFYQWVL